MPTKDELINSLISGGYLKTPRIIEAFWAIDRKDFVPPDLAREAYGDYPLPIGHGQTISQPLTVAFMLERLNPKPGERMLDVGTGSGWVAGLLAHITGRTGRVVSVDRIKDLVTFADENLLKYGFVEKGILKLVVADGSRGYEAEAPYDKIIAAAAGESVLAAWKKQLKIGGRIVAPIGQSIVVVDKTGKNRFITKEHFGFSFVPLVVD